MTYTLLTGATGLLGRYLMRGLLMRDQRLAVLIRSTRLASARQRMESALVDMERLFGETLPRPVVLEGELTEPNLALDANSRRWISRHVSAVLHNAASLSFDSKGPEHEPWISNVHGTEHVLELTRQAGIREFHHVSTAYVCGLRNGVCREDELDEGQEFGNDYERSKLKAEQLVRAASWLDDLTIYRPAIIVGDSRTGFTNTFHGFYTPLKIVSAVINKMAIHEVDETRLIDVLGLGGTEQKNLVPVDWVADTAVHLFTNRRCHGRVYHLTPTHTVSIASMLDNMADAVRRFSVDWQRAARGPSETDHRWNAFLPLFREQMSTYQAYWRDDPRFDKSNTLNYAGDIACPTVDEQMLFDLCQFAIENKFWWSRGERIDFPFDAQALVEQLPQAAAEDVDDPLASTVVLRVFGLGGGEWEFVNRDGRLARLDEGGNEEAATTLVMHVDTLAAIVSGKLTAESGLRCGRIVARGSALAADRLVHLIEDLADPASVQFR